MKPEEIKEKVDKTAKYSGKIIPKILKYLDKLDDVAKYEEEFKKNITVPLIDWFLEVFIINAFLIFICLSATGLFLKTTPNGLRTILLAEGISILWYLIVQFKQDLWRKNG